MSKNLLLVIPVIAFFTASSQNFTGQWKGEFLDKSSAYVGWGGDKCDYVLELEVNGNSVGGSSYTYFTEEGKRFYTICKLKGFIDRKKKYIEVRETERTKTNVPRYIRNCFQVHKLTYFKKGNEETIEGNWVPAPDQTGDCGYGTTLLSRRSLVNSFPNFNNSISKASPENKAVNKKPALKTPGQKPIVSKNTKPNTEKKKPVTLSKKEVIKNEIPLTLETPILPKSVVKEKNNISTEKLDKRINTVIKTIEVINKTFKVDLYDNGEIDGDSISLFYNGKLLLANKKLSAKAISLTITVDEESQMNQLVMYAENLGSIPPNTALMVVTDGPNRYEVRITSDLKKSGVINFILKEALTGN